MSLDAGWEFLIGALRPGRWRQTEREALASRVAGSDPELLVRRAAQSNAAPLLHDHLEANLALDWIPDDVADRLAGMRRTVRARNAFLFKELSETASAWHAAGFEAVLLKGAALPAYGSIGSATWRPMSDVDLLIRVEAMDDFAAFLATRGFANPKADRKAAYYASDRQLPPLLSPTGVAYELHYTLLPHHRVEPDRLWAGTRTGPWPGASVLAWEDHLAYQLLHIHHHRMQGNAVVKLLADWAHAFLIPSGPLATDWDRVIDFGRACEGLKAMAQALAVARGASAPLLEMEALEALQQRLGRVAGRTSVHTPDVYFEDPERVLQEFNQAAFREALASASGFAKLVVVFRKVFPAPDDLKRWHGLARFWPWGPVIYLLRPFRLLGKALRQPAVGRRGLR